jgi:hypothetical protein
MLTGTVKPLNLAIPLPQLPKAAEPLAQASGFHRDWHVINNARLRHGAPTASVVLVQAFADGGIERFVSLLRRLSLLECAWKTEDRIRKKEFIGDRKQGAKFGEPVRIRGRVELAQGVTVAECVH